MITNIWLKSQPEKKHSYPNCYPVFYLASKSVHIKDDKSITQSTYLIESINRIEFRP
jgi:hypothetical protein